MSNWGRCPHCGGWLTAARLGVPLSPLKARIFDAVVRAGTGGISSADLLDELAIPITRSSLRSHVTQINEKLYFTGWRIQGGGGYRLEQDKQP